VACRDKPAQRAESVIDLINGSQQSPKQCTLGIDFVAQTIEGHHGGRTLWSDQ